MTDRESASGSDHGDHEAARQARRRSIEALIDDIGTQSFPASDPPAWGAVAELIEQAKRDPDVE
jgi:hypothetical protein